MAVVQLFDPESGACLSVMDGTYLTAVRTGAASAMAAKYLARRDAESVAVFGAGLQAESQLEATKEVRGTLRAKVFDPRSALAAQYSGGAAVVSVPSLDHFQCYRTSGFCAADSPRRAGTACESEKQCGGTDEETSFCKPKGFQGRSEDVV